MSVRLLVGDCRETMAGLEAGSIQACVCSPPYFGLRSYDGSPVIFGGDPSCPHSFGAELPGKRSRWGDLSTLSEKQASNAGSEAMVAALEAKAGAYCGACGAWRGFLGLEARVEDYVAHLVEAFGSVRRVLHDTGTLWVNLGDSYAGSGKGRLADGSHSTGDGWKQGTHPGSMIGSLSKTDVDLPPGNLIGVPWRVAYALQADGWILRSAICCTKISPMPESVAGVRWQRCRVKGTPSRRALHGSYHNDAQRGMRNGQGARNGDEFDSRAGWLDCPGCPKCEKTGGYVLRWGSGRPTSAYEMLFVFAKTGRYYFDPDAVRRELKPESVARDGRARWTESDRCSGQTEMAAAGSVAGASRQRAEMLNPAGGNAWNYQKEEAPDVAALMSRYIAVLGAELFARGVSGRDLGDAMRAASEAVVEADLSATDIWVWRPEGGFDGEHYAVFPASLPSFAIKAGTPEKGVCPHCRSPWARVVHREPNPSKGHNVGEDMTGGAAVTGNPQTSAGLHRNGGNAEGPAPVPLGWRATCNCPTHDPIPATVLDCFGGAATSGLAADRLGRDAVLCEISEKYAAIARRRLKQDSGLFAEVEG